MFKTNTLLVVGAGASKEFGLPVGEELADFIRSISRTLIKPNLELAVEDAWIMQCLTQRYPDDEIRNDKLNALAKINKGVQTAGSIDSFIHRHSEDPSVAEMGKLLITSLIAQAERNSRLHFSTDEAHPSLELASLKDTWIYKFARILFEKVRANEVENVAQNVSIICFNYDRCIEFYLIEALRQGYDIKEYREAHRIVQAMEIVHPYGTLGTLPTDLYEPHLETVPFGHTLRDGLSPWSAVESLKTYTEQVEEGTTVERMREMVASAEQVLFLGFSFQPENMELLQLREKHGFKTVYSTGKGVSRQEANEVVGRIAKLFTAGNKLGHQRECVHLEQDATCAGLFQMHWRNLSLA